MGDSLQEADFEYDFFIDSISPREGGIYGGQLLTIKGRNFLTK